MPESTLSNGFALNPDNLTKLRKFLIERVTSEMEMSPPAINQRVQVIHELLDVYYQQTRLALPPTVKEQLFRDVFDELLGFGPIQSLLDDPTVTEIMVNSKDLVYIEQEGKLLQTQVKFEDDQQVMQVIERIIMPLGRRIDADSPMVDARLPDGSRVNAIIPPVAIDGPSITIRKFGKGKLPVSQLIEYGTITPQIAEFVRACVVSKLNILVSGGTGTGKTTLLNVFSGFIPEEERIVTIEDAAELKLQQRHVVRLETKPANLDGEGAVSIRDLVRNALRMRPDRIVVGEVRGGEAMDMLQAMNTGHDGSLTTLHANSPRDTISRLETMCMMAGMEIPLKVVRQQIASAIDLIIQLTRLKDGTRKISSVTEVAGMEGEVVTLSEIYKFDQTGIGPEGRVLGEIRPQGIRPFFMHRLEAYGFKLGPEIFGANLAGIIASRLK